MEMTTEKIPQRKIKLKNLQLLWITVAKYAVTNICRALHKHLKTKE